MTKDKLTDEQYQRIYNDLFDESTFAEDVESILREPDLLKEIQNQSDETSASTNDSFLSTPISLTMASESKAPSKNADDGTIADPLPRSVVLPQSGNLWSRVGGWSSLASSAASLLIGLALYPVLMTPTPHSNSEAFSLFDLTVGRGSLAVRGGEEVKSFSITSQRPGFVTVVAIDGSNPADLFVAPSLNSPPIRVSPESPANYLFAADLPSANWLIFVVTETQADSTIIRGLSQQEILPDDAKAMSRLLSRILKESGFHWTEIGSTALDQPADK